MRRFAAVVSLLFTLFVPVVNAAAQVITADPNTGGTEAPKVEQADARLLKPVTYQAGYKRLNDIADELTKLTGVAVRSGSNNDDWQVRDIPLVVCVKDMPLGRLLKMLAAAAHVQLASETTGKDDPTRVYRFIRTLEGEKELTDPTAAKIEANRKLANWAWDAMVAYGKMPDAPLEIRSEYYQESPNVMDLEGNLDSAPRMGLQTKLLGTKPGDIKAVARVMAALDPGVKQRVFSGEQVTVTASDTGGAEMRELYQYISKNPFGLTMAGNGLHMLEPTFGEMNEASLQIKLQNWDRPSEDAGLALYMDGFPFALPGERRYVEPWKGTPLAQARVLAYAKGLDLPPAPDVDAVLRNEVASPGPEFERIVAEKDFDHPALRCDIKPDLPQGKDFLSYAETLTVLAKASGFNIVCEDFMSQQMPNDYCHFDVKKFDGKANLGQFLMLVSRIQGTRWFLSKDERLLVGHVGGCREHYANLMPADVLARIHDKMNGEGAELDDLTPLLQFTSEQLMEWVGQGPDLAGRSILRSDAGLAVWRLYDLLKPEYKTMAKSSTGLPLAMLDPMWTSSFIKRTTAEAEKHLIYLTPERESKTSSLLADPDVLKDLVMRVETVPLDTWEIVRIKEEDGRSERTTCQAKPNGLQKRGYKIVLTGEHNGDSMEVNIPWEWQYFPRFTPQKELELYKKAEEKK